MRNVFCFLVVASIVAVPQPANACDSTFEPVTGAVNLPCIGTIAGTQVFDVTMKWAGGNNFTVTSSSELTAYNPNVITLKIVTTPVPVALIHAYYPSGCARSYARPSAILTGNNVDIRLKGWAPTGVVCTAMAALFVESVALPVVADNQTYTYTINGVSVAPTY